MDAITLVLQEDHRRIGLLSDAVGKGDMSVVPQLCDAILQHSRVTEEVLFPAVSRTLECEWDVHAALDPHTAMRQLVADLGEESTITPSYVSRAGTLMKLIQDHVREEEDILFPQIATALEPSLAADLEQALQGKEADSAQPQHGAAEAPDAGAASDGDASWAETPMTQDPDVDRSVDAVIRRTQGH